MDIRTILTTGTATHGAGGRRWVRVGHSRERDARAAGTEAARQALGGDRAGLVIVFCSDSYDLAALVHSISAESGVVPMIGCSTAGEIATPGPAASSVVVVALGGDGFSFVTTAATGLSGRLREAGSQVARCLDRLTGGPHRALILLSDGLAGDQQELVRGVYEVVGASIPLVGGCAGDDLKMKRTFQFHDGAVLEDAIVAAGIASSGPIGIGVRHGWRKVGEEMLVTRSSGTRVLALDDLPALDVYLDRLDAPADVRTDPAAFTHFAMTHPLGLMRRSGEYVRFISGADLEERSLVCIAHVPENGIAWVMEGDRDSVLAATDAACHEALAALHARPPIGVLAFDCIARRGVLGEEGILDEINRISHQVQGAPVGGFYTYGEFARTRGISGFHNQTLVVLALS